MSRSLKECWTSQKREAQWHHALATEKPIDFAKNAKALQKREAQANRADTSIVTNAQTLLEFLTYVVRQTWIVRSSEYHATEQAQSSGYATEQTQSQRHDEDCANIVFDTIKSVMTSNYAPTTSQHYWFELCFYDQSALLVHKQMLDIMSRNKEGLAKENMFIEWCRRVQRHIEAASTASPSTDTEHVFNQFLLHLPFRREAPSKAKLQSMLQDLMTWHASLLQSILDRPNHPGRSNARIPAALDQTEWRMHRREQKEQVEQEQDQRTKVEKDKDHKKTKEKVKKEKDQRKKVEKEKDHKKEKEKEKDKVGISSSTTISSSTRSSSSTGISKETVEHQAQKKQKMEQVLKASVCLDPDTPDDEEQFEKDMAVDHLQKERDEKKKKKEQVEQEKDQRTKVEKDKDPPAALQKREAQANRADTSIVTLCWTLLEFLTYVLRETWIVRSSEYHATEQAKSQKNSISDRYSPGRDNYDSDEEVLAGNCCNERKKGRTAQKDWGGPTTGSDTDRTFLTDDPKRGSKPRSRSNSYENVVINPQQLRGRKRSRKEEDPKQNAPDQAQSSGHATEQTQSQRHDEDCGNIVFDTIASVTFFEQTFYDEPALLLHKQMWDIMSRNKEGLAKKNMFIEWCRRVQKHTDAASTDTDTEHVFKSLALDLLSKDLTPEQRHGAKYKIFKDKKTGEIPVTTKQRSWINTILRKNLGHSKVAYFIFNHGVPALLDLPLRRKAPSKAMLQSMLEELMTWHASLLQSILERQNHPDMANARKLAALDQTVWRMHRRERKKEAQQRMVQGSRLVKERDSSKRNFEDMSAAEQQVLEDFDTGRSAQRHAKECEKKLPCFRGKML